MKIKKKWKKITISRRTLHERTPPTYRRERIKGGLDSKSHNAGWGTGRDGHNWKGVARHSNRYWTKTSLNRLHYGERGRDLRRQADGMTAYAATIVGRLRTRRDRGMLTARHRRMRVRIPKNRGQANRPCRRGHHHTQQHDSDNSRYCAGSH